MTAVVGCGGNDITRPTRVPGDNVQSKTPPAAAVDAVAAAGQKIPCDFPPCSGTVRVGDARTKEMQPVFINRNTQRIGTIVIDTFDMNSLPFDVQIGAARFWCSGGNLGSCHDNKEQWVSTTHGYNPTFHAGTGGGFLVYQRDTAQRRCGSGQSDINWMRVGAGPYTAANEGISWGNMVGPTGIDHYGETCASGCPVPSSEAYVKLLAKEVSPPIGPAGVTVFLRFAARNVPSRTPVLRWTGQVGGNPLPDGSANMTPVQSWPKKQFEIGAVCDGIERIYERTFTPGFGEDIDKAADRGHFMQYGAVWTVEGVD